MLFDTPQEVSAVLSGFIRAESAMQLLIRLIDFLVDKFTAASAEPRSLAPI